MIYLANWHPLDPDVQRTIAIALITAGACGLAAVGFLVGHARKERNHVNSRDDGSRAV
jgi:hypothetical protein